jgi:catechol 2,3-dioxygenase-like lactoylglutathione lyase family enzyme
MAMRKMLEPVVAALLVAIAWSSAGAAEPLLDLSGLDHFAINVRDLEKSTKWYGDVFGFKVLHQWKTTTMVGRGAMKIGLFLRPDAVAVDDTDNKIVITHIAFLVDGDKFDKTLEQVKQMGLAVDGPEDTGIAFSFFFKDPDGHLLEVTTYHAVPAK